MPQRRPVAAPPAAADAALALPIVPRDAASPIALPDASPAAQRAFAEQILVAIPKSHIDYHDGGPLRLYRTKAEVNAMATLLMSTVANPQNKVRQILRWLHFYPDDLLKARNIVRQRVARADALAKAKAKRAPRVAENLRLRRIRENTRRRLARRGAAGLEG